MVTREGDESNEEVPVRIPESMRGQLIILPIPSWRARHPKNGYRFDCATVAKRNPEIRHIEERSFHDEGLTMKKMVIAILAALTLFGAAAWAQNKAQPERITNGPVVKKASGTIAEIAWSTDAPGSSIVKYGTSASALNETAEAPWGGTKEPNGDYNHTVWMKNLKPNTTYYFIVETTQGAGTGTQTQSQPKEFHTAAK